MTVFYWIISIGIVVLLIILPDGTGDEFNDTY